jgi:lipopolysaccharide transport system ATP-binding protein
MSDIAIKFENISKQYRLGLVSTQTIQHDLNRWWQTSILGKEDPYLKIGDVNDRSKKATSDYVWALRDISFDVQQGDVLGIIGKNGAGKSTLLKILSKVTTPTTGIIKAKGRIASLLEVGTGFHPELTGRENIYMNGAIMGMTKQEISRKLDEIVDFSGVERYLDTPTKRYSSGMTVRLGFAVAAHLDPEILVVDEVLAVGDAEFQKKAIGKMQDVSKGEGRTVLFVSHNMVAVNDLCKTGVLLKDGSVFMSGTAKQIIAEYLSEQTELSTYIEWNDKNTLGNDFIKLRKAYFIDKNNNPINLVQIDEKFGMCVEYEVLSDTSFFTHGINVYNKMEVHLFTSHDNNEYDEYQQVKKGTYKTVVWLPANYFQNDRLDFSFACMMYNPFQILFHEKILSIDVVETFKADTRPELYRGNLPGVIRPILNWNHRLNT